MTGKGTLGLIVLASAIGLGLYWAARGPELHPSTGLSQGEVPALPPSAHDSNEPESLTPLTQNGPSVDGTRATVEEPQAVPQRVEADAALTHPERAIWVQGRVVFPEGTPQDEQLFIEARGKPFDGEPGGRRHHRAPVQRDGRFRVAFSPETQVGSLEIWGNYCYLKDPVVWNADDTEELLVEPLLGTFVELQLHLPTGSTEPPKDFSARVVGSYSRVRGQALAWQPRGRLSLPAVPPGNYGAHVTVVAEGLAEWSDWIQVDQPGVRQTQEVSLEREARITGRVLDENGQAVESGQVFVDRKTVHEVHYLGPRSDGERVEDGRYTAKHLGAGDYEVKFQGVGYLSEAQLLTNVEPGQTYEQDLTVRNGHEIHGTVRWVSGEPAAGASVRLVVAAPERGDGAATTTGLVEADAEGRFTLSGFVDREPVALIAAGLPPGETPPEDLSRIKRRRWLREHEQETRLDEVVPGGPEVELVLGRAGLPLAGQVVDQDGEPVRRYRLTVAPRIGESFEVSLAGARRERIAANDGRFLLQDLPPGAWGVRADARGYLETDWHWVALPTTEDLPITLPLASSVRGRVVQTQGKAIRAQVTCVRVQETNEGRWEEFWETRQQTTASEQEGFAIIGMEPGTWRLLASTESGQSEPLELNVSRGEQLKDVELLIPTPGSLTGSVHADWWQPGLHVVLDPKERESTWHGREWSAPVDSEGRFTIEALPAGEYQAQLEVRIEAQEANQRHAVGSLLSTSASHQSLGAQQPVTIHSNRATQLFFSGHGADSVHLFGRVLESGEPATGWKLTLYRVPYQRGNPQIETSTDEQGRYSVMLPQDGRYSVRFRRQHDRRQAPSQSIQVRPGGEMEQDFTLPAGRLELHLTFPDGQSPNEPLAANQFHLLLQQDGRTRRELRGSSVEGNRVLFYNVQAGTYRLATRSLQVRGATYVIASPTSVTFSADSSPQIVPVQMARGCKLQGRVTGAPEGVGSLHVLAFLEATGYDYVEIAWVRSDGEFYLNSLPAGDLWLSTQFNSSAEDRVHVQLIPGVVQEVQVPYTESSQD